MGLYGYADRRLRQQYWALIRRLVSEAHLPWILLGDFNKLLSPLEKRGTHPHHQHLCNRFKGVLQECSLLDLEFHKHPYTWEEGRGTPN